MSVYVYINNNNKHAAVSGFYIYIYIDIHKHNTSQQPSATASGLSHLSYVHAMKFITRPYGCRHNARQKGVQASQDEHGTSCRRSPEAASDFGPCVGSYSQELHANAYTSKVCTPCMST